MRNFSSAWQISLLEKSERLRSTINMYAYIVLVLMLMFIKSIYTDPGVCDNTSDWFHCWESNVGEGTCTGEPNSAWIRNTQVCNGLADCPNGEDESILECKHVPRLSHNSYFYCATGAAIEMKQKCDGEVDCSDGSDEMQTMCQPGKQINRRGNCEGHGSFECRPGECFREIGLCDGKYDCSNGFDESLEVCYQQWHNETQFQCGNGRLISTERICNGIYDCIDAADELANVCDKETDPKKCQEPRAPLSFTLDTKYHRGINGTKYVLPLEVVKVQCIPTKRLTATSSEWNVCGASGKWANRWPKCKKARY